MYRPIYLSVTEVLQALYDSNLWKEDTLVIVEASQDTDFDFVSELGYEIVKFKKYKSNMHVFLRKK